MDAIRFLDEIQDGDREAVGGKGLNLGLLRRAGLPVPEAFCIVSSVYREACETPNGLAISPSLRERTIAAYRRLGGGRVAVRSSAAAEDGRAASFAGQQETILGVLGEAELCDAVLRCWRSIDTERARAYRRQQNIPDDAVAMGVVVQNLIDADSAGVLFTRDPTNASERRMLVESAWGLGESVVSGRVSPDRFHLDFETGAVLDRHVSTKPTRHTATGIEPVPPEQQAQPSLTDEQLRVLAELGRNVEEYYGAPQDIEWAVADGKVWLLQSRPITAMSVGTDNDTQREQIRREEIAALQASADPRGTVWAKYNLAEILPEPTPMTWSIVQPFMAGRGGFGLMYRDLGFDPDPALDAEGYFDLVCGRPYANLSREARWHFRDFPYGHDFAAIKADPPKAIYPQPTVDASRATGRFWLRLPAILFRVMRANSRMKRLVENCATQLRTKVFPALAREVDQERRVDYSALNATQLVERLSQWRTRVLNEFARESLRPAMFAAVALAQLEQALSPALGNEAAANELRSLLVGIHPDPEANLSAALSALAAGQLNRDEFVRRFGHRGPLEMELSRPRWRETPEALPESHRHQGPGPEPDTLSSQSKSPSEFNALLDRAKIPAARQPALIEQFARLRTFLSLRETSKHYFMLGYDVLRRLLVEIGNRTGIGDGVFFLTVDELPRLAAGESFAKEIPQRREHRKLALSLEVPPVLFSDDLEAIGRLSAIHSAAEWTGVAISAGVAEGPALVLTDPADAPPDAADFVLVCPSTDPAWTPLFLRAKALVMETGGMLSHGAIVAREFGLPAVAGVAQATSAIRTGQPLHIDGNAGRVVAIQPPG